MAGQSVSNSKGLEQRSVVSSFIFHFPNELSQSDNPLVALFKRSQKVNTYKHLLAPISGTISRTDPNALSAAWRELFEETGLDSNKLTFSRAGQPYTFTDESVHREWTIHPFAFQLKGTAIGSRRDSAISIDWEHEGWEWFDPSHVLRDDGFEEKGVPHLRESLRRLWLEGEVGVNEKAGRVFRAGLERLKGDRESGSHELTGIALGVFREFLVQMRPAMEEQNRGGTWWEVIQMAAWHIVKNGRESMGAATLNALLAILEEMEEVWRLDSNADWKLERMLTIIDHHLKGRTSRAGLLKETFASYVRENFLSTTNGQKRDKLTILTLSASSTIRDSIVESFASLDINTLELRVLESRPLFEGMSIASSILSNFKAQCKNTPIKNKKLHVNIYTDASSAIAAANVDIVLLGADRISRSKGVSNKTGSLPVVLSAKHVAPNAKIVVLSELEKVNGENGLIDDEKHEDNDPHEILKSWHNDGVKGIKVIEEAFASTVRKESCNYELGVRNVYFEWIPLALVDAFVSGEGVLSDARILEKARQQEELARRYFDGIPVRY
ncbi:translation initiation factor eIF-2B subunit family protein [Aspergillus undulatus]|uniref:translation initiation factor eIF-2B subunit family protein n=1 Tax=Aspergillus undulatus TaxID=1810928 RepID=UPI003CCCB5D4